MGLPALRHDRLELDRRDFGRADSLSFNVLTLVADEKYERAIEDLNAFVENDSGYPSLRSRIERHANHGIDLINAIRTKRNFPGFKSLTAAKQNELKEKTLFHFEELKFVLKKIERIQVDVKLEDIRSTVIVIRALVFAGLGIVMVAFVQEISHGLFNTAFFVIDDWLTSSANYLMELVGL